ncbi:hypothetical protein QBZ16_004680 [Prototheca wickerhamii]|uniref:dual-specificity kinase n=1 Tax=Prototheca wickerhamii TaxID=3111 RepID=A0AAD9IKV5_PROWI|nr:hypothetical protein QBZ16_004680 [Prototheca wickerhamii]
MLLHPVSEIETLETGSPPSQSAAADWEGPKSTPRGPAPSGNGCVDPSTPEKSAESLLALQSPPSSSWSSGPLATAFYQGSSSLSSTARDAGVRPAGPLPISTARGDRHDSQTGLTPRLSDFALSGGQWGPGPPRSLPIPDVRPPKRGVSEAAVPVVQRSATSAPSLARPGLLPALSAYEAAQRFGHLLTPFEREEVHRFQKIWFVGRPGTAKLTAGHLPALDAPPVFADERGNYMAVVGDHIAYRYEVQSVLGQGSFGQVLRCADHAVGGRPVALKIMRGKRRFQKQALVETKILSLLQGAQGSCPGVVLSLGSFSFRGHLCIAFELLSINLYELLQERRMLGCGPTLVRSVAAQVLRSLDTLEATGIVHCDIKPENIMLVDRKHSNVKLIDFGSSCFRDKRAFTYIQSRFYRAPEVILGEPYGHAIDMWSLACVLAEMRTGTPLFPGEDEKEQLACIMEVLGKPPQHILDRSSRASVFFDLATGEPLSTTLLTKGRRVRRPGSIALTRALGTLVGRDASFVQFLSACLVWESEHRLRPSEALRHPWILEGAS